MCECGAVVERCGCAGPQRVALNQNPVKRTKLQSRGYMLGYALCGTYPCVVVKIQFSSVQFWF